MGIFRVAWKLFRILLTSTFRTIKYRVMFRESMASTYLTWTSATTTLLALFLWRLETLQPSHTCHLETTICQEHCKNIIHLHNIMMLTTK